MQIRISIHGLIEITNQKIKKNAFRKFFIFAKFLRVSEFSLLGCHITIISIVRKELLSRITILLLNCKNTVAFQQNE